MENATGRPKRSPTACQEELRGRGRPRGRVRNDSPSPAIAALAAVLMEQLGHEFIKGRAPNFHGMDLIRVLLEGVRNLQLIQALDEFLGTRAGYRVLAAGRNIQIMDIRRNFLGCLQSLLERLRFTQYPSTE